MYTWRITDAGTVVVQSNETEHVPVLGNYSLNVLNTRVKEPWLLLAVTHANRTGLPVQQILAHIFAESLGNQKEQNQENPPGLGLMQITNESLYRGHSRKELLDNPDLNLFIGCNLLNVIKNYGNDIPQTASGYNAGLAQDRRPHPSSANEWGMRCSASYIDTVVMAYNSLVNEDIPIPSAVTVPDEVVLKKLLSSYQTIDEALAALGISQDEFTLTFDNEPDTKVEKKS